MSEDRKYRQHGYQDSDRERRPAEHRPPRENLGGPRQLNMPARRSVVRCAGCGAILPAGTDTRGQCPQCKCELHSCKQCVFFDTSARFECAKPVTARIARKDARNECSFYQARVTVERDTSSASARPLDARAAFEALFKK
jgi:hypothetical protein